MKRFHVHVHVADLDRSIAFYSRMFGAEPARIEPDYAKWMLEDPRINFAISTRGATPGLDHLGLQTDDPAELAAMRAQAEAADLALHDVGETTCCYARSDKHWITDPQGIAWEHFHTMGEIAVFREPGVASPAGCCANEAPVGGDAPVAVKPESTGCGPVTRGKPVGVAVKAATPCC